MALGVKKGDQVWTCTNSFVASANCALYCQAKVDLVDTFEVEGFGKKNFTIMSFFNDAYRLPWGYTDISVYMQKKITNNFKKYLLDKNAPNEDVYDMDPYAYD